MGVDANQIRFQLNNTTGNQSITGVGAEPLVNLFLVNRMSALIDGERTLNNANFGFGVGISSTERAAVCMSANNGQTTSQTDRRHNGERCITMLTPTGVDDMDADFVSQDSDGFTVNITNSGIGQQTLALPIWGTPGQFSADLVKWEANESTGIQSVSSAFVPKLAITFTDGQTKLAGDPTATAANGAFMISGLDADGNQFAAFVSSLDGATTTVCKSRLHNNRTIIIHSISDGTVVGEATGELTETGMDINWSDASDVRFWTLFLGGNITSNVGVAQAPATDIGQDIPADDPQALILVSHGSSVLNSVVDNIRLSMGFSDGGSGGCVWYQDEHGVGTSDCDRHFDSNQAIWFGDDDQNLLGEAFATLGIRRMRMNWSNMDGSQPQFGYIMVGNVRKPKLFLPRIQPGRNLLPVQG